MLIKEALKVRPFKEGDIRAVGDLATRLGLSPWTVDDYRAELKRTDSRMAVCMIGSRLAGFIVARRVPGSKSDDACEGEIYNIGVDPDHQRNGVGTRLLAEFLKDRKHFGMRDVWLDVRAGNASAIRFYEKFGFREVFRRPDFYNNPPDDGIVMQLRRADAKY